MTLLPPSCQILELQVQVHAIYYAQLQFLRVINSILPWNPHTHEIQSTFCICNCFTNNLSNTRAGLVGPRASMDGFLWVTDSLVGLTWVPQDVEKWLWPMPILCWQHTLYHPHTHTSTTPSLWQQKHLYTLPNVPGVKTAPLFRTSVLKRKRVPSNY